jgi:hypothetical protein
MMSSKEMNSIKFHPSVLKREKINKRRSRVFKQSNESSKEKDSEKVEQQNSQLSNFEIISISEKKRQDKDMNLIKESFKNMNADQVKRLKENDGNLLLKDHMKIKHLQDFSFENLDISKTKSSTKPKKLTEYGLDYFQIEDNLINDSSSLFNSLSIDDIESLETKIKLVKSQSCKEEYANKINSKDNLLFSDKSELTRGSVRKRYLI